jgi:hypothetical protein
MTSLGIPAQGQVLGLRREKGLILKPSLWEEVPIRKLFPCPLDKIDGICSIPA